MNIRRIIIWKYCHRLPGSRNIISGLLGVNCRIILTEKKCKEMTIGIIIPLKSQRVAKNWDLTCNSLAMTINSIVNQTEKDYVVVVAGHECPAFLELEKFGNIFFKKVDFFPPIQKQGGLVNQPLVDDKNLKIIAALHHIEKYKASHIFQLDADDLLHVDFIKTLKKNKQSASSYILQGGYIYYSSTDRVRPTNRLNDICGSTAVVKSNILTFPPDIDLKHINTIPWTKYRHMNIYKYFENDTAQPYSSINEKLIAYVVSNGDNFSDRWRNTWLKRLKFRMHPFLFGKKADIAFKKDFSLFHKL